MFPDIGAAAKALFALAAAIAAAAGGSGHATHPGNATTSTHETTTTSTQAAPAATTKGGLVKGKATHYGPASTGGNCSFPSVPANKLTVAAGPDLYANGAGCGGYLDVTSGGRTIRVKITDKCPECGPGHIDLTDEAFAALAPLGRGIIPTTYRIVTNPRPAQALSFRVKEGSSQYWLGLLVDGTGNRVKAVQVKSGGGWRSLQRTDYGYWLAESGAGNGPFTVRVTDVAGHRATASGIRLAAGTVQRTGVRLYP